MRVEGIRMGDMEVVVDVVRHSTWVMAGLGVADYVTL